MDELKPAALVRVPVRVYRNGKVDREETTLGRIMVRNGYGYAGNFTRDNAGQYMVQVGDSVNPLRVMVLESEVEVVA